MDDTATRLLEIQKIDSARVEIKHQLDAYPRRLRSLRANLEQARRQLEDAEHDLKETRAHRKLIETEIAQKQEAIRKFAAQQMQVKSNKEYQAIEHQVATIKDSIGLQEEEVIGILDREDTIEARIAERREILSTAERDMAQDEKRIAALETEKRDKLQSLDREREVYVAQLPDETLDEYNHLFERYPGEAIVSSDGKTCGGCNWNLLPQVAQKLNERKSLVPCHHCSRLLYLRG